MYLRKNDTLRQLAAGFWISLGPAHAHVHAVVDHLAGLAPGLTAALRSADARYVLLDGTLAECDRAGDARADYSGKHRRHRVNLQAITAPDGTLVGISPALPGRTHDLTAARRHRITATYIRLGIPVVADRGYQGASDNVAVPHHTTESRKGTSHSNSSASTAPKLSVRSVQRWRRARRDNGQDAVCSRGPVSRPKLSDGLFAVLEEELAKGPIAHGWPDQRWTLARIKTP